MLTDQIKRKVNHEIRDHFVDVWGKIISSEELVDKIDEYESVRKIVRRAPNLPKFYEKKQDEKAKPFSKKGEIPEKTTDHVRSGNFRRNFRDERRENNFEKRKVPECFSCGSKEHLRPQCPLLKKKENPDVLNNLSAPSLAEDLLAPYMSEAKINGRPMSVLRDSGATIDLVSFNNITSEMLLGETVWVKQPLDLNSTCLPLARIEIEGEGFGKLTTKAAVINSRLDPGYYLLGNRTAELIKQQRSASEKINSVVTRSKSRANDPEKNRLNDKNPKSQESPAHNTAEITTKDGHTAPPVACIRTEGENLRAMTLPPAEAGSVVFPLLDVTKEDMRSEQQHCRTLVEIRNQAELEGVAGKISYVKRDGLYFRLSADHHGNERVQLILPEKFREGVKTLCHEDVSAHLGVTKTKDRVLRHFFWPNCFKEIEEFVRSCDPCQRVGKSGDKKKAPLKTVPIIKEVFSKINIDTCGPLPESPKGNRYIVTAICMSSKYPDAIPVADISSVSVTDAFLNIFSRLGFPKEVQCDQGTSFTSNLTTEFFEKFGIKVTHSSVYHPQSNPVERFHRTIKRLLRVLLLESGPDWEKHLPACLLALRTVSHESTGFSPAELVHGKNLRTPETLLYEHWVEPEEEDMSVTDYVFKLLNRLQRCQELAADRLQGLQEKRKLWYDKKAVKRKFKVGDSVLVLATAKPNKLAVQWLGPGTIEHQISETNYIVKVPGKKERSQIYHVNMLKPYHKRPEVINLLISGKGDDMGVERELDFPYVESDSNIYDFEEVTRDSDLGKRLDEKQIAQLEKLLDAHGQVFSNAPGMTDLVVHDVELISNQPVRSKPYRTSPRRSEILRDEIKKMLEMRIIEIGESDYTSPMILVEAPNKEPRPCIDYRRLNQIIRTEFFPLPNIEERVEKVASAKYISVLDLAKGYWQIALSPKAQRLAAFVTPFGTYRPLRMPFGLKNAPYFFSKLMAQVLQGCEEFAVPYLDDIAIFSDDWDSHLTHLKCVLGKIAKAQLTVKASKCRFAQNHVKYLGHMVGDGFRTPAEAKIQTIIDFPQPATKTQLRAFLGLAGYYGHYIPKFSVIAAPLTNALKGKQRKGVISWNADCDQAFKDLKGKLTEDPVLFAPDFSKEFIVQTDASNVGMGVVLSQQDKEGKEHPVLFLSKKFSETERNFSTIEKECASIIFAIKKLHYYLDGQKFTIMTDHNPLVWLKTNASNNPRVMRWSLALQPYDFKIVHRSGKANKNADCLSRIEDKN